MKSVILLLSCVFLFSLPSCTNDGKPSVPDLIAATTPATSVLVAKKPALVAPLKQIVAILNEVSTKGSVTPSDLIASFSSIQQKHPELVAIIELVSAAYQVKYSPTANNLSTITALATAIQNGLPADPQPTQPPSA